MLANQGLLCAYVHHAADGPESAGHDSRSHFHLGGHDHHTTAHVDNHKATHSHHHGDVDRETGEHDGDLPPTVVPLGDHDANATYCAETVALARDRATPITFPAKCVWNVSGLCVADHIDNGLLRPGPIRGQPASVFDAACPIYLRTLSLRI